ncbi:HAD family hydrolase [Siminovitchia sediminis]|uniref:HAD family hydrolase n=1 Tax=Siminovitchia sediminis TaxID=1274353 RepID=A0ABW4KK88_9BACI
MKIHAIVFDFDGLMVDTESAWYEAFRQAFRPYGYELPIEEFALCVGTYNEVLFDHLRKNRQLFFSNEEIMKEIERVHHQLLQNVELREGVLDYLRTAKQLGLKIGLATSSGRDWVEGWLKRFNLLDAFDAIKTSEDVTRIKPDPELYQAAVSALKADPGKTVAFEDSKNGLQAALGAGLHAVAVPNPVTSHLDFEGHALRLDSMADMPFTQVIQIISSSHQMASLF